MRLFTLTLVSAFFASAISVVAQDEAPIDEIISQGTIQTDPAMSAWNAGDFTTAEIEFKKNAFCALRAQRNFESAVESARESSTRSTVGSGINATVGASDVTGGGPAASSATQASSSTRLNSNNFKNKNSASKRTCENRGFQIYMMGLSQLKLGKVAEAKETFSRSVTIRKDLYDAHFRLGLLEYQDGNISNAKRHFEKLKKLESRYKRGEANKEIKAQIQYLKNVLG